MSVIRHALATVLLALPLIAATSVAEAAPAHASSAAAMQTSTVCPNGVIGWDASC
jgi:hypothetical protein